MVAEDQLIDRVCRKFRSLARGVRVGIGDDAAVVLPDRGKELVLTVDQFLENVHFLKRIHPPDAVGYKALARATSDLAAMGAQPRYFLLTLALPASQSGRWLDEFLTGLARAARRFGLVLIGGDTSESPTTLVSLTIIGASKPGQSLLRSGARPGDLICVSGRLGEAELGLRLVLDNLHRKARWRHLLAKHFHPEPRLKLGEWLAKSRCASAAIDTSDGLSTDLGHICKASGIGARIWADKIPVARVPAELARRGFDPFQLALHGGEDYELLFTVHKRKEALLHRWAGHPQVTVIGEITREKKILLCDSRGRETPLPAGGWDPFRK